MGNISHYAHSFSHYAHNLGMSMTETSSIHCLSIKKEFEQFLKEFCCRYRGSIPDRPCERRECYPLYQSLLLCQRASFRQTIHAAIASRSLYMSPIPLHAQIFCAIILILVKLLLENSRPTACYFQWNSWKLG